MQTANAQINSARITLDRGIFLCLWLQLNYDDGAGGTQGYGGIVYAQKPDKENLAQRVRVRDPLFASAMVKILTVLGVESFEDIEGSYVRVKYSGGFGDRKIEAIGNILKDKWFSISEDVDLYVKDDYFPDISSFFLDPQDIHKRRIMGTQGNDESYRHVFTAERASDAIDLVRMLNDYSHPSRPRIEPE